MQHIALLRGINVGKAKRIAMADLRRVVQDLGFARVRTLLNSGNVVYEAGDTDPKDAAQRIEQAIARQLGVRAPVLVVDEVQLAAVAQDRPLADVATDPARTIVTFVADPALLHRLEPLTAQDWGQERLALRHGVAWLWCPEGVLASRLVQVTGKLLGDAATSRNEATVLKLHALAQSP